MPKKIQVAVGTVGATVICAWCAAGAWRLHRRFKARRRLLELLAAVAGQDARIVITGADSGIGQELARQCATHPRVSLLLGCRYTSKDDKLRGQQSSTWGRQISWSKSEETTVTHLELLDFDSVQRFAEKAHVFLAAGSDGLRLLVNSAGVIAPEGARSASGFGVTWQTNFLGPFLLTELLARFRVKSEVSRPLRVVQVTSSVEEKSQLTSTLPELDEPLLETVRGEASPYEYADSKRALMLWTSHRAQNLAFNGNLFVHAATPGKVNTRFNRRGMPDWLWWLTQPIRLIMFRTPAEGALAAVAVGLSPNATQTFGRYVAGDKQLEDLVVERIPEKRIAVKLVKWASQVTSVEARANAAKLTPERRSAIDEAIAARARAMD